MTQSSAGTDPVANAALAQTRLQLQLQLDSDGHGYLPSLRKTVDMPVDSQVLVFSKTSLQFDLQTRLFPYPLRYTIYGRAFANLSPSLRDQVYRRLFDVLSGKDHSPKFAHLSAESRQSAIQILRATKSDLPGYWR